MALSTTERILGILALAVLAYRYATGRWPVEIEVEA